MLQEYHYTILTPYACTDGFLMIEKDKVNSKGINGGK